ncbi:hypothetical protein HDV02_001082 [Globomyces sp. JEL0801]|nr:hypothetical protein HDV02_001082 [Globomyces sp. JEL0801]
MAKGRKKSKKTHVKLIPDTTIPRSFVIKSGNVSPSVVTLIKDMRRLMEPNTATNLKERRGNKIKDFLMIAGQLMVTHLMVFSKSSNGGVNLRIGKIPRGPTLTFHVQSYVLSKDVFKLQKNPKSPGHEFLTPPLVVLNNFGDSAKHVVLLATMLQNMFPSIKVTKMKLSDARRVILFNYNTETNLIEMRHYKITIKQLGLSKSVKAIIHTKVPDLRGFEDISDFILRGAFASESDVEDGPESTIQIGKDDSSQKRAIKLFELGPRLELQLIKIEDGLCGGEVIYHAFKTKDKKEIEELSKRKETQKEEKARRRAEQERNVKAKKELLEKTKKLNKDQKSEQIEEDEIDFDQEDFSDLMEEDSDAFDDHDEPMQGEQDNEQEAE